MVIAIGVSCWSACPACGVVALGHGRHDVQLVDAPAIGQPVRITWRKRRWRCPDPDCVKGSLLEQNEQVARPRALLTMRTCRRAIAELRRENASVHGLAPRLGTTWHTVWDSIEPLLAAAAADESRFADVASLGVDEHIVHHVWAKPINAGGRWRGTKELTGMVDLTPEEDGQVRARLLDLVPGRTGAAYGHWLQQRGAALRKRVKVATLDPFQGYKNAIQDDLAGATAILDAFHVVELGVQAVDDVRGRVQQATLGQRGRRGDSFVRDPHHSAFRRRAPHRPPATAAEHSVRSARRASLSYYRNRDDYRPRMLLIGGGLNL